MRSILLLLLICMSHAAFSQCQSPNLILKDNEIKIIDNFNSGMYKWMCLYQGDTISWVTYEASIKYLPLPIKPGARIWLLKYCQPFPLSSNDGMEFLKIYNAHKDEPYWVTSNTVTIK